jgi:parvulin-like peptidyl-prolyl isomerase
LLVAASIVLCGGPAAADDDNTPAGQMVARVNGEPVTAAELDRMLSKGPADDATRQAALQKLIDRRLVLQDAKRRELSVSAQDFDRTFISLRNHFEDLNAFGSWMHQQGLDERTLFDYLRDNVLVARATAAIVADVQVSEAAIRNYYQAHARELLTDDVWIQMIVVDDRQTAEKVQRELDRGTDFGLLAQRVSLGQRATQRGDLGWVNSEALWPPLRKAVQELKPGEAIGPLARGEDEFLIVRLEDRRPGRGKSFTEARDEIASRLLATKQQEVMRTWLADQKQAARIELSVDP